MKEILNSNIEYLNNIKYRMLKVGAADFCLVWKIGSLDIVSDLDIRYWDLIYYLRP